MTPGEIRSVVQALDTAAVRAEEDAWLMLKPLGIEVVPYLAEFYPHFKKWQGRTSLIFHSMRYARTSEAAFQLGLTALKDKSTLVRYRACGLLAYSLRADAVPPLRLMSNHPDERTAADALATLDAIESKNHHLFVDRQRSGKAFWVVNDKDREA